MYRTTVSILTPSFNREDLIEETLESVLAQTWLDWEMIIVDDGSSDRTKEIAAVYAARDPRIKLFDRQRLPKGACTCRNEGVEMANGEYVLFLDTDDLLEPFCLEQRVGAMRANPELDFSLFPGLMFEKNPNDLGLWWNIDKPEDQLSRQFKQDAICQGTGMFWRRDSFIRIGMWKETLAIWQDIDLFFRAYIQGYCYAKFFDLPPDLHNRTNHASLSRAGFYAPAKLKSRIEVIKNAVDLLNRNHLRQRIPEARFMTAEIIFGAARSRQFSSATSLLNWAVREGVFSTWDTIGGTMMIGLCWSRLIRLPILSNVANRIEQKYHCENTLGKVPVARDIQERTANFA